MEKFDWRAQLSSETWEEGKVIKIVDGSYRMRSVVTCCAIGRQQAVFANGMHNISAYVELTRPDGTWISQGMNIVPVLPDGRIIMVVEQRPPHFRLPNQPRFISISDQATPIDLMQFGPCSSLEFPGGAVDQNDRFNAVFLRELQEETEVEPQPAMLYERLPSIFPQGSDIALEMKFSVIFLTRHRFSGYVKNDGGLQVFALTPHDIQRNIWAGNIRSGQAALLGWSFYQEVIKAHQEQHPILLQAMERYGYLSVRPVTIA